MEKQTVHMRIPKTVSAAKAIRAKCLDCSENQIEVRDCPIKHCPLWAYRFGANPQAAVNRLQRYYNVELED